MIHNQDRTGYFGGSDGKYIMGKWNTKTFQRWWDIKTGLTNSDFQGNLYTEMGNQLEPLILDIISKDVNRDRQIILEQHLMRINLDGDMNGIIYEVKTHGKDFTVNKQYWYQAQVEMYAYQEAMSDFKKLYIVSYQVYPEEYGNEVEADYTRLKFTQVDYDHNFITNEYLPRVDKLVKCLKQGEEPWSQ